MIRVEQRSSLMPNPSRPRAEPLAHDLVHAGTRATPANRIFWWGERLLVAGGGEIIEVDATRPVGEWRSRPFPKGFLFGGTEAAAPLFSSGGVIYRLEPDLSLRDMHRIWSGGGEASVRPVSEGRVVVQPERRALFGTYLLDASGRPVWRLRSSDSLEAFDDVLFTTPRANGLKLTICRSTATGEERWRVRGLGEHSIYLIGIVGDAVWFSSGTALFSIGLERGEERARIDHGKGTPRPRLDPSGLCHLLWPYAHWVVDLRSGKVLSRRHHLEEGTSEAYTLVPLAGGDLLARAYGRVYRFEPGDGEGPGPRLIWTAPALADAMPHRNGLVVLVNPSDSPGLPPDQHSLHWLAPA